MLLSLARWIVCVVAGWSCRDRIGAGRATETDPSSCLAPGGSTTSSRALAVPLASALTLQSCREQAGCGGVIGADLSPGTARRIGAAADVVELHRRRDAE